MAVVCQGQGGPREGTRRLGEGVMEVGLGDWGLALGVASAPRDLAILLAWLKLVGEALQPLAVSWACAWLGWAALKWVVER